MFEEDLEDINSLATMIESSISSTPKSSGVYSEILDQAECVVRQNHRSGKTAGVHPADSLWWRQGSCLCRGHQCSWILYTVDTRQSRKSLFVVSLYCLIKSMTAEDPLLQALHHTHREATLLFLMPTR